MAVNIELIKKLRKLTNAGLSDCKKALEETNGDINASVEIIRAKGKAVAAKRSDRETANGCVLVKVANGFAAMIAVKCETDFVANNQDTIDLTQSILDAAIAAKAKNIEEVNALTLADGQTVADAITSRAGVTGEKTELDGYFFLEGENIYSYNHQNKNGLCTLVQLNQSNEEIGHGLALHIAAANPLSLSEQDIPADVRDEELKVALEKTRDELVEKAVQAALKKAGYNLYIAENEEHIAEGIAKKEITEEQAEDIRRIKKETAEEKAANLPEAMIQNIANGRMNKFYKQSCLLNQDYCLPVDDKTVTVQEYLQRGDKNLTVVAFRRFTLSAE